MVDVHVIVVAGHYDLPMTFVLVRLSPFQGIGIATVRMVVGVVRRAFHAHVHIVLVTGYDDRIMSVIIAVVPVSARLRLWRASLHLYVVVTANNSRAAVIGSAMQMSEAMDHLDTTFGHDSSRLDR